MSGLPGILALEDGTVFEGKGFGARATVCGEAVFNTSITGYQEILTDPSYKAQIVTMTYPQIGNYGVNDEDVESWRPHVAGFVVRELCWKPSNWRSEITVHEYLTKFGIPGLTGVDTRSLTSKLRVEGAMKACLSTEGISPREAVARAREWHGIVGVDYVRDVTHREPFIWDEDGQKSARWVVERDPQGQVRYHRPVREADLTIVAIDYGVKYNILRSLRRQGFRVQVVPSGSTAEEVMRYQPRGVLLSNGPGDPEALDYAHRTVRGLLGQVPIFGICLGHQILSFAVGGRTFKLKFGHRGGNHPVKDLPTGKVAITSQNHGFAVDPASLPADVEITQINLYDKTVEGLRHKRFPAFSVQYHPEASPGPHDTDELFAKFRRLIETGSLS